MSQIQQDTIMHVFNKFFVLKCTLFLFFFAFLTGCQSTPSYEIRPGTEKLLLNEEHPVKITTLDKNISDSVLYGKKKFRLVPGDVLSVYFYVGISTPQKEYKISVGDKLEISFYEQPKSNLSVYVRPDGRISLPLKGDISVVGLQPAELEKKIARYYSDVMIDPSVTVNLGKISSRAERFIKMINSSLNGQVVETRVTPSGVINLAMLPPLKASGLSMPELQTLINKEYGKKFAALNATVTLKTLAPRPIYVFGEVKNPGLVAADHPGQALTIMQAIVSAGGPLQSADLKNVLTLYRHPGQPSTLRKSDVLAAMQELKIDEEMILPYHSIVYVPPTSLTKASRWMDKAVRKILLFNGFGVNVNYEINTER